MTKNGNPFRVFWKDIKGRGHKASREGIPVLYIVALYDHEIEELSVLSEKYPDVKSTIDHVWKLTGIVHFRVADVTKVLDKRTLEEKNVRRRQRGR